MIDKKTLELINNIDLLKELSIYINKEGEIKITSEQDFSHIDAVELLKIGVFVNEKTISFFKGKKVCRIPKKVKDISHFFYENENEKIEGLEKWDVSNVEYMVSTFENCTNFNQDLSHWNVENVFNVLGPLGYDFDTFNWKDEFKPKFKEKGEN